MLHKNEGDLEGYIVSRVNHPRDAEHLEGETQHDFVREGETSRTPGPHLAGESGKTGKTTGTRGLPWRDFRSLSAWPSFFAKLLNLQRDLEEWLLLFPLEHLKDGLARRCRFLSVLNAPPTTLPQPFRVASSNTDHYTMNVSPNSYGRGGDDKLQRGKCYVRDFLDERCIMLDRLGDTVL